MPIKFSKHGSIWKFQYLVLKETMNELTKGERKKNNEFA